MSGSVLPDAVRSVPLIVKFLGVVVVLIPRVLSLFTTKRSVSNLRSANSLCRLSCSS